jgi:hypothetical protein
MLLRLSLGSGLLWVCMDLYPGTQVHECMVPGPCDMIMQDMHRYWDQADLCNHIASHLHHRVGQLMLPLCGTRESVAASLGYGDKDR